MSSEGFLSRWSRRKAGAAGVSPEQGHVPKVPDPVAGTPGDGNASTAGAATATSAEVAAVPAALRPEHGEHDRRAPMPAPAAVSLPDPETLTPQSDFTAFMQPGVDAGVRSAALKKLFADPHFNVMDGLDVYIEDFGKPDPLPAGMLRRMVQSQMLRLFDEPEDGTVPPSGSLPASAGDQPGLPDPSASPALPEGEDPADIRPLEAGAPTPPLARSMDAPPIALPDTAASEIVGSTSDRSLAEDAVTRAPRVVGAAPVPPRADSDGSDSP